MQETRDIAETNFNNTELRVNPESGEWIPSYQNIRKVPLLVMREEGDLRKTHKTPNLVYQQK